MSKLTDLEYFCKKMNFPTDFGTVFSFDFQLRTNATEEEIKYAIDSIKVIVRMHLECKYVSAKCTSIYDF